MKVADNFFETDRVLISGNGVITATGNACCHAVQRLLSSWLLSKDINVQNCVYRYTIEAHNIFINFIGMKRLRHVKGRPQITDVREQGAGGNVWN
jgi:hypothetical protein